LNATVLIGTDLCGANHSGSSIYGIAAWDVKLTSDTRQENLIITPPSEPAITVDNIKVAQFIYLLINNKEVRHVIDAITSKAVLILGPFTPERKIILDRQREELRSRAICQSCSTSKSQNPGIQSKRFGLSPECPGS
jgi:hypothetical protein